MRTDSNRIESRNTGNLDAVLASCREDPKPFAFICATEEKCAALLDKLYKKQKKRGGTVDVCRNAASVFDNLTVIENIFIHSSPLLRSKRKEQYRQYANITEKCNIHISPDARVQMLTNEEKYLVELLRCVFQNTRTLILSSISAVLGIGSFESFCTILELLQKRKTTVLIVSTRWEDTIQVCDRIAVESGINKDSYSMLWIRDIKKDPQLLFYALADYEEPNISDSSVKALNVMLDIAIPQSESRELDRRIMDTLNVAREQLNAVNVGIYFQNGKRNFFYRHEHSLQVEDYELTPYFIRMMMDKIERISFFSRKKYNYQDIFIRVSDNVNLLVCHPIFAIPDKIGIMVILFDKNILCTDEQIVAIQMCCNLLGNMICSSYIANKDIFIEESNHRVKNNLQTIISLLFIQKQIYHSPDRPDSIAVTQMDNFIENMVNRIKLIADMHDFVAKNHTDISDISSDEIIHTVIDNYRNCRIQFRTDAEYVLLPYETASVVVMILNEMVCNSIKHAFKDMQDDAEKFVDVSFKEENRIVCITVRDNGRGVRGVSQIQNNNSLGMKIITSLSRKLRAELKYESVNGTQVSLRFKK